MSSTKHTPGPWFQVEGPQYGYNKLIRVESADGQFGTVICERFAADKVDGLKEEVEANMALIAAAPDLLEVATMILFSIDGGGNVVTFQDMHINQLREAIEKATQP
jgi:hypothetical protein